MTEKNVAAMLLNAALSGPGMKNGKVKISREINFKTAFSLSSLIYKSIGSDKAAAIFEEVPEDTKAHLEEFADELVQRADLSDTYELLKSYPAK